MLISKKSGASALRQLAPTGVRVYGGEGSPLTNLVEVAASIELAQLREVTLQHLDELVTSLVGLDQTQAACGLRLLGSRLDADFLEELGSRHLLGHTLGGTLLVLESLSDSTHGLEVLGLDGFNSSGSHDLLSFHFKDVDDEEPDGHDRPDDGERGQDNHDIVGAHHVYSICLLSDPTMSGRNVHAFLRHFVKFLPGAVHRAKASACQQGVPHDALDLAGRPGTLDVTDQVVNLCLLRLGVLQDGNGLCLCIGQREVLEVELFSLHGSALKHEDCAVTGQDTELVGVVVRGEDRLVAVLDAEAPAFAILADHVFHEGIQLCLLVVIQTGVVTVDQRGRPEGGQCQFDQCHVSLLDHDSSYHSHMICTCLFQTFFRCTKAGDMYTSNRVPCSGRIVCEVERCSAPPRR